MQTATETTAKRSAPPIATAKNEENAIVTVKSRFGDVEADTSKKIFFKHGILGIPAAISFCLTKLPGIDDDQFKLLQCMEDDGLSFIVVPSQYDNQLLKKDDLNDACKVLEIQQSNLLILFIVTVHEKGAERRLSVNAKAPVFVDAANRTATQYVLPSDEYEIQHMIS